MNAAPLDRALSGDIAAVARVLSVIESHEGLGSNEMDRIFRRCGRAEVIGITGTPGAGKSTLVAGLVDLLRKRERKVAVLAVDPSSPKTGGAVLGDRLRLNHLPSDSGVFFRSMATRGQHGGLSLAAPAAIRLLDAMGMDSILVETVGVGQNEVAVAAATDVVILVLAPGAGDWVQVMKAGVLEVADFVAINKADLPGAAKARSDVHGGLRVGVDKGGAPEILLTQALNGDGLEDLLERTQDLLAARRASGALEQRRLERLRSEAVDHALWRFRREVIERSPSWFEHGLGRALAEHTSDPVSVGDAIVTRIINALSSNGG